MGCCGRTTVPLTGPRALPGLNVASALEMARNQFKTACDGFLVERRIQACRQCPYFQKDLCNRCGCYLVAKVGILEERCPLRKW